MKRSLSKILTLAAITAIGTTSVLMPSSAQSASPSVIDQVFQQTLANLERAKIIIGSSMEVAGAYNIDVVGGKSVLVRKTGQDYIASVIGNFAFGDVNKDGVDDLAVAVETVTGARSIRIYLGDTAGKLELASKSSKAVLRADEGGQMGDPLTSVTINSKSGVVRVSHFGGSRDRWGIDQKFQLRNNEMVLIGRIETTYDSMTGAGTHSDLNLVTGDKIARSTESDEGETRVVKSRETVRSLIKMADAEVIK